MSCCQALTPRNSAPAKRWAEVQPPPMMSPIRFTPRNTTRLAKELQPYLRLPMLPPITEVATVRRCVVLKLPLRLPPAWAFKAALGSSVAGGDRGHV